jgi:hypothetical protein
MSPAALPLVRIPVGIVVGRSKADSPWTDFCLARCRRAPGRAGHEVLDGAP